ncbi:THUMP domain-containing protein 1-like [Diadema setosum]|uniref:THUMP domain-containing protein 1-like n=1 Tax=Diadema setosum TaxID=31175 RepID=UPI003B3B5C8F
MDKGKSWGKKKNKSYYRKCGKNISKKDNLLQVGMTGVLITCSGFEAKCVKESYNLLNEYADRLYGPEKATEDAEADQSCEEDSDEDIAESLRKEVSELNQQYGKKDRRFKSIRTGAKNVIFIQTKGIDPHEVVYSLLADLEKSKTHKARQIQRMLPVSHTCRPFEEKIEATAKDMLYPFFHGPDAKDSTFCVMVKSRNNNSLSRNNVIRVLASMAMEGSLHQHKVNFDNPDLTIMVDVVGKVCCLSVLRDYQRFKKFNLYLIAKGTEESAANGKRKREDENVLEEEEEGKSGADEEMSKRLRAKEPEEKGVSPIGPPVEPLLVSSTPPVALPEAVTSAQSHPSDETCPTDSSKPPVDSIPILTPEADASSEPRSEPSNQNDAVIGERD